MFLLCFDSVMTQLCFLFINAAAGAAAAAVRSPTPVAGAGRVGRAAA